MRSSTIVHCENSPLWGGQEIRTFNESKWFFSRGFKVIIIAPENAELIKRAREIGMETFIISCRRKDALSDLFRLIKLFLKEKPNVISTHGNYDGKIISVAAALSGYRKNIFRYRHVSNVVKASLHNKILYNYLSRHIITTGDCISEHLVESLKCNPQKISTIGTGIEAPKELLSKEQAHANLCEELSLDPKTRFIGCIAVLRSWKGHTVLVEAFNKIIQQFENYHLIIIGSGDADRLIEQKSRELNIRNKIHLLGYRDNVWPYFRALDLHILASQSNEGIPQTLLQAHFANCPIVGTNVGGIPEVIQNNQYGYLSETTHSDAIYEAAKEALENQVETQRRSDAGFKFVKEKYSIDKMGEKITRLYEQYGLLN